jgi:hypothetical protein
MFPNQLTKLAPTQNILPELLKNYNEQKKAMTLEIQVLTWDRDKCFRGTSENLVSLIYTIFVLIGYNEFTLPVVQSSIL